jgi:hypothetical protein
LDDFWNSPGPFRGVVLDVQCSQGILSMTVLEI